MAYLDASGELSKFFRRVGNPQKRGFRTRVPNSIQIDIPDGIDWEIWRIVASDKIQVSLIEIQTQWSVDDMWQAHEVLDMYQELEARAHKEEARRAKGK